jgi:hypothetical protein
MAYTTVGEVQAWLEPTKLTITEVEPELEDAVATFVLARLSPVYEIGGWLDELTTPKLVRKTIAVCYAARLYDRQYSEDEEENKYAQRLHQICTASTDSIVDGTTELQTDPGVVPLTDDNPSFYPNDESSSREPGPDDPSAGGPYFRMGRLW